MTSRWGLAGLVAVLTAVGPVFGFLWWAASPVVPGIFLSGQVFPREDQPGGYVATDVYFAIAALVLGLVAAIIVRKTWTGSPVIAVVGLTLGGIAGSALAVLVGYAFSAPKVPDVLNGQPADVPLSLGAPGWLLVWPIASVGLWFVMDLFSRDPAPVPTSVEPAPTESLPQPSSPASA